MSVLTAMKKRQCCPVKLGDDTTVHVRGLTVGELDRLEALGKDPQTADLQTAFIIGRAVVDAQGTPEWVPLAATRPGGDGKPESDEAFARRVLADLEDVPTGNIYEITRTIHNIGKLPASVEAVVKN